MILYRYFSKRELNEWLNDRIDNIDCTSDKNNDGLIIYNPGCIYFTTNVDELLTQRKSYKISTAFGRTYLCSFNIPSSKLITASKVGHEIGYDGQKTIIYGIRKDKLRPDYFRGSELALRNANVVLVNTELGLTEIEKVPAHKNTSTDFRSR